MHTAARNFTEYVKSIFTSYFVDKKVLDVGGGDINGNNRFLFVECEYHANDVVQAPNVTIVSKTGDLTFPDQYFDTIISTECFEHDMYYSDSLRNIVRMLKPGGLFVFTCASVGRPEHGTRKTTPKDSYTMYLEQDFAWHDYYKNLTAQDIMEVIPCNDVFTVFSFYYNPVDKDMYFYGIKKGKADEMIQYNTNFMPYYLKPSVTNQDLHTCDES